MLSLTAWEHGMDHVQEERYAQGFPFMAAALNLMDFSEYSKKFKEVNSSIMFKQDVDVLFLQSVTQTVLYLQSVEYVLAALWPSC